MMQDPTSFGHWLKQCRQAQDLTQAELARQVSCSISTLEKIEAGRRRPSRQMAERLALCLKIDSEDLEAFVARARAKPLVSTIHVSKSSVSNGTTMPEPTTAFIGRKQEMAALMALLLQADVRLVTLAGPGGVGKTRLGLQVAARLAPAFLESAAFASLASVDEPALVASVITRALGLKEESDQSPVENLKASIRDKHLLLVLDNFEHVLAAAPLVADLLKAAPLLKILVTSRALLHLPGEQEFGVAPLTLPDLHALPPFTALTQFDAIRLFVARAQAAKQAFQLTPTNAQSVVEICARLDGLPLAIELAAAQSKQHTPAQLLARLERHLTTLTGNAATRPARHQTLHHTIDWSYQLLSAKVQALFVRLAIFIGGFSKAAAVAVCATKEMADTEVHAGLSLLVEHNLIQSTSDSLGKSRFTLLDTIREYGLAQLEINEARAQLHQRHARYYLRLAETAVGTMFGPEQATWFDHLEQEHDNLRHAIKWLLQEGQVETAARLVAVLWRFWWMRGYLSEGQHWLETLLTHYKESTPLRLSLCQGAGLLVWLQGEASQAEAYFNESLRLSQELDDPQERAFALAGLGWALLSQGNHASAQTRCRQSLALCRASGDTRGMAWALTGLGWATIQQDNYEKARIHCRESLALARASGDEQSIAFSLLVLGKGALIFGDYEQANTFYTESADLCQKIGNKTGLNYSLNGLGWVALLGNDFKQANKLCTESLAMSRQLKDKRGIALALNGLAWTVLNQGEYARAQGLWMESQILSASTNDQENQMLSLTGLGWATLYQGDVNRAEEYLHQALRLSRLLGHEPGTAMVRSGLGWVALLSGKLEEARTLFEENLAWCRRQETIISLALTLNGLGAVALATGDNERAHALFKELLSWSIETNDKSGIVWGLEGLAGVAMTQGRIALAATFWGAAARLRLEFDFPIPPVLQTLYTQAVQVARHLLAEPAWVAAWTKGETMTLAQINTFAFEQ
jgi:predicted ATPase/DNA-binding XRE family transcriptional regulator